MIAPVSAKLIQLLPFVTFAFVASITPGPSNLLVLGNSARYGFFATLPIVLGSCMGSAALVMIVGFGLGGWLAEHPTVQTMMSWGGAAWMSYLAWQIAAHPAGAANLDLFGQSGLLARGPRYRRVDGQEQTHPEPDRECDGLVCRWRWHRPHGHRL